MSKLPGHPSHHGHDADEYTCLRGEHRYCSGFSGPYETHSCGCCCHDPKRDPRHELTDSDRAWIERVRRRETQP